VEMGEEDLTNHAVLCICNGGNKKLEGCMLSVNVLLKFQNSLIWSILSVTQTSYMTAVTLSIL